MNTGFQRSAATPKGAWTTTSPDGKALPGKTQQRKNLTAIAAAHGIPYVAQASPHNFRDLIYKAERAFETPGPAYINILSPCPRGWRSADNEGMMLAEMMVKSKFWPLYEVIEGRYVLNYDPKNRTVPVRDWMSRQGRFKHLFTSDNEHLIDEAQAYVDHEWARLKRLVAMSAAEAAEEAEAQAG
jgi:pyruvate ferredoxin oxidoreductase beta subunit